MSTVHNYWEWHNSNLKIYQKSTYIKNVNNRSSDIKYIGNLLMKFVGVWKWLLKNVVFFYVPYIAT